MSRSVVFVLVAIALIAAAASWWLLAGGGHRAADWDLGDDGVAPRPSTPGENANEQGRIPVVTEPFAGGTSGAPAQPPDSGLLLEVVERGSGHPVPHAIVYIVKPSDLTPEQRRSLRGGSSDAVFRRFGRRLVADERGRTRIPRSTTPWRVAGAWGTLWGTLSTRSSSAPYRLELWPVPSVSVIVEDEGARPVPRVQIALIQVRRSRDRELASATTDDDGFAVLRCLEALGPVLRSEGRTVVTFAFPLAGGPEESVDLASPPVDPLHLVLPRTGSVAVAVGNARGDALILPARVSLRALEDGAPAGASARNGSAPSRPLEDGKAVFDHVGVGLRLQVVVHGEDFPTLQHTCRGPRLPGDRVEVNLTVERLHPLISGRVLDPSGQVLAGTPLRLGLQAAGPSHRSSMTHQFVTDERGVFAIAARTPLEKPGEWILSLALEEGGETIATRRTIPAPLPEEGVDLGDVRLATRPVVVSGVVTDDENEPVSGASIWARVRRRGSGLLEELHWDTPPGLTGETDSEGKFEIVGEIEGVESRLYARREGFIHEESVPFTPGAQGVRVVLQKAAGARGSLLVSPDLPLSSLRVSLESGVARSFGAQLHPGASDRVDVTWSTVAPGTYTLSVRARNLSVPILSIPNVVLRSGEVCEDPRLAAMDLRRRLRSATLTVVDETDNPLAGATLVISRAGPGGVTRLTTDTRGVGAVLLTDEAATVSAWAPGFRMAGPDPVEGDTRIVLSAGLPVRIALDGLGGATTPGITLQVVLGHAGRSPHLLLRRWRSSRERGLVDQNGQATLTVPASGRYQVTLLGTRTTGRSQGTRSFHAFSPRVLQVGEADGQTLYRLTLEQPELERWLRR